MRGLAVAIYNAVAGVIVRIYEKVREKRRCEHEPDNGPLYIAGQGRWEAWYSCKKCGRIYQGEVRW